MASLKERVTETLTRARERLPVLDHTLNMLTYYGRVRGNDEAGAVSYFGFLSFFPILALGVFVVGIVANVYPDVRQQMTDAINGLLPGLIGTGEHQISLDSVQSFSGWAGLIGLAGVLYSGLGWLSALRRALEVLFSVPAAEQPNFVFGKLRDLLTLALIGLTLFASVVVSGAVTTFTGQLLSLVGIDQGALLPAIGLNVLGHVLGIAATMALILLMFELLVSETHAPSRAQLAGALLGAIGFEVLKVLANLVIASLQGNAAFATFGVALVLLVWINYFSRLVMYSAAWAYTAPSAFAQRTAETTRAPGAALVAAPVTDADSRSALRRTVSVRSSPRSLPPPDPADQPPPRSVAATEPQQRPWLLALGAAALGAMVTIVVRGVRR